MGTWRATALQGSPSLGSSKRDGARVRLETLQPGEALEEIGLAGDGGLRIPNQ